MIGIIKMIGFFIILIINILFPEALAPYTEKEYRDRILSEYTKKTNIIMNDVEFKVIYNNLSIKSYNIKLENTKRLKTKYIPIKYNEYWGSNSYQLDIHRLGEEEYIINELLFDHSKGNYFDKIEEYLDENKERILKSFMPIDSNDETDIFFEIMISNKLNKELDNIYFNRYNYFKIENNEYKYIWNDGKNPLNNFSEKEYFNNRNKKEKIFFNKPTKYDDIDWSKYMEYMGDYPILIMMIKKKEYIEEDKYTKYENNILDSDNKKEFEEIKRIYKEIEKWYNPETFKFVIRKIYKE